MVTTELNGLTAEEAFQALKRQSQRTNIKLHTIADKIVDGGLRFRPAFIG
jgi:AmiR/NasT family two-component response regulator